MFTQKRNVLTLAAVIATLATVGGVGAAELAASRTPSQTAQPAVVAAAPVATAHFEDVGGGDQ